MGCTPKDKQVLDEVYKEVDAIYKYIPYEAIKPFVINENGI